jgi:hypothetical protein
LPDQTILILSIALALAWLATAVIVVGVCRMAARSDADQKAAAGEDGVSARGLATVTHLRDPAERARGERSAARS